MLRLVLLATAPWLSPAGASLGLEGECKGARGALPEAGAEAAGAEAAGAVHLLQRDAAAAQRRGAAGSAGAAKGQRRRGGGVRQRQRGRSPEVPRYVVDLDLPPRDRFRKICRLLAEEMLRDADAFNDDIALRLWTDIWIPQEEQREWIELVRRSIPREYLEELEGIQEEYEAVIEEHGGAKLPFHTVDDMLLLSLTYDINYPVSIGYPETGDPITTYPKFMPKSPKHMAGCSGILVATPNGTVLHGRNLDYVFYGSGGSNSSSGGSNSSSGGSNSSSGGGNSSSSGFYEVIYTRGGKALFLSISGGNLPSTVGTGMRFGAWSVSQNLHHANKRDLNLQNAKAGGVSSSWELRRLLEVAPDFDTAVDELQQTRWMSPQYFVVAGAGPNEGAVVTAHRSVRDESSEAGYPKPLILTRRLQPQGGTWYLVQTNDEAWALPDDDRRLAELSALGALGREGVNETSLMQLLRTPPALQFSTLFSWVAMPATNYSYLVQNETGQTNS